MTLVEYEVLMIPYSYNMVNMGGIDLAEANGTVVPGIYEKIVEAMNLCGDLILYNWKFAGILISPSACAVLPQAGSILINGLIQVTELDQITVIGLPPPPVPVVPLEATENGIYEAELPQSGFNPVSVAVPERIPVIEPLEATANGIYSPTAGIDGFGPVTVEVEGSGSGIAPFPVSTQAGDYLYGWYGSRVVRRVLQEGKLVAARWRWNNAYACGTFYSLRDYPLSDVITGDYIDKVSIDISSLGIGYNTLYSYGGTNGGGGQGSVYIRYGGIEASLFISGSPGENMPSGPTNEANFGTAFSSMSDSLKEQFISAILQTV
jgi:hypothetical protein